MSLVPRTVLPVSAWARDEASLRETCLWLPIEIGSASCHCNVAVIGHWLDILEPLVCCQPVLQQRIHWSVTPALLNSQSYVHFVGRFREEPEVPARCLLLVEIDVAVRRFHRDSFLQSCIQTCSWFDVVFIDLFLHHYWNLKVPSEFRRHSGSVDDKL